MTWTCLRTIPRQERRVLALLEDTGVLAYAPMEVRKVVVKHPHRPEIRRIVPRTSALIPSYVFAFLPDDDAIDAARSIRLVREIMSDPFGKPRKVDLAKLRGLLLADLFRLFDDTWEPQKPKGYTPRWRKGDRVKIKNGVAQGWIGVVVSTRGRQQVEVLFDRKPLFVPDDNLSQAEDSLPVALVAA